jgi:hypothetical protein
MKQLPTAKEFYESFTETLPTSQTEEAMIEFARLHVEQALIEASENAESYVIAGLTSEVCKESISWLNH